MAEVLVLADHERRSEAGLPPKLSLSDARDQVIARTSSLGTRALVTCSGSHVVGTIMGLQARENDGAGPADVPGLLHVSMLAVVPDSWGRRIGARMLTILLDGARSIGYRQVQLWSHTSNARANALCERLGFTRSARTQMDARGELLALWGRTLH
jgi:ribosomal protein S18 acetylase RimI-like enzyme